MPAKLVHLSIGTNLGDRPANLRNAFTALEAERIHITARSSLYETEPQDFHNQPWFLNAVVACETKLFPMQLMSLLQRLERELGRVRLPAARPRGPRLIDLDILLYGASVHSFAPVTGSPSPHARSTFCPRTAGRDSAAVASSGHGQIAQFLSACGVFPEAVEVRLCRLRPECASLRGSLLLCHTGFYLNHGTNDNGPAWREDTSASRSWAIFSPRTTWLFVWKRRSSSPLGRSRMSIQPAKGYPNPAGCCF